MKGIDIHNAAIGSVNSRADKSLRFSVETPEMTPEFAAILISLHGCAARIMIQPNEVMEELVEVTTEREVKSPTQRLYSVLYLVYKTNPEFHKLPFDAWRQVKMEAIIEYAKKQIKES